MNLNSEAVNFLLAKASKNGGRISAEDYRRAALTTHPNASEQKIKEGFKICVGKPANQSQQTKSLNREYHVDILYDKALKRYDLTLKFRHLGKNSINGASMQTRIAYKNLCKKVIQACHTAFIAKYGGFPKIFKRVRLDFAFFVPKNSRDRDANFTTINFLIDGLVNAGFLEDDNRDIVTQITEDEILDKNGDYKVVLTIKAVGGKKGR